MAMTQADTQTKSAANLIAGLFANPLAWVMWLLGALFYFYEFLLKVSPGVMMTELMQTFDIAATGNGVFYAVYFWIYAPMQMIVGMLLDRFGPHRLLTAATGACALGTLMFASTDHFSIALVGRALIGLGSAFAIVGCMKIIANWFPPRYFATMLGFVLTIGMLGAIVGQAPLKILINHFDDWRKTMYILAGTGMVLVLVMLLVLRDRPDQPLTEDHPPEESHEPNLFEALGIILKNSQFWLAALYGGLMFGPFEAFAGSGVDFLNTAYGFSDVEAGWYYALVFIGFAIGSPITGLFADTIHRRLPSMYIGTIASTLFLTLVIYVKLPGWLLAASLFGFGFFTSGFLSAFPIIKEINPAQYNATALGFMNTMNMIGGMILPIAIGFLLDAYWAGTMLDGAKNFTIENYRVALSILPLTLIASFVFLPFIKETFCKHCYEPKPKAVR